MQRLQLLGHGLLQPLEVLLGLLPPLAHRLQLRQPARRLRLVGAQLLVLLAQLVVRQLQLLPLVPQLGHVARLGLNLVAQLRHLLLVLLAVLRQLILQRALQLLLLLLGLGRRSLK